MSRDLLPGVTGVLALADGTVLQGMGVGAVGEAVGLAGVDTRALTRRIREHGMPHAVIAHAPDGRFDLEALLAQARAWKGLVGLDLAKDASCLQPFVFDEGLWAWGQGYARPGDAP